MTDENAETLDSQPEHSRGNIPREIGQYKVRRVIGSGGMGTLYEAIQESPSRKVAIKVMRSGVTSRSAMRRFEYESQILGRLSHRCIAFAGEDHEDIEKYRKRLDEVTAVKNGDQEVSKELDL